jgi:putative ABC transport system permease protein
VIVARLIPVVFQDIRFAIRTLSKSPMFVAVAVFSLSLGIGANTAIFTLIDQLLLRMLPVKDPQQLVLLTGRGAHYGSNNGPNKLSYPMYSDFRDQNKVFQGMFCRDEMTFSLSFQGKTERVAGEVVSGNFFPVLGVGAAIGRVFGPQDDLMQGANPYAVLSYGYWETRFGRDPGVIGQKLIVNGYPVTVIGVSQAGFHGVDPAREQQIRIPVTMAKQIENSDFSRLNNRRWRWVQVYGRLKPGESLEQAKAGLQPLFHQMLEMEVRQEGFAKAAPLTKERFLKMWLDVLPAATGKSYTRERFSKALLVLMSIVGLVLLIACANVANLLVARATARQKEIAVRLALGASRGRIIGQLLVESLMLSITGGIVGVVLSVWIDQTLIGFLPTGTTPLTISSVPDTRILLFALVVTLATGVIFGLVPALQATKPNLAGTLKDQAGAVVGGGSVSMRKILVVAQVTLSLILLIAAGLFIRSLSNLKDLDPGFRTKNLMAFNVDPTLNGYPKDRSRQFYQQLYDAMNATPGVKSASLAIMPVLQDNEWDSTVSVEGYSAKAGEWIDPHMNFLSPGYFKTMEVPILVGRDFDMRDDLKSMKVAIVNEKFAKKYLGGVNAIGRHIGMGGDPGTKTDITVIGVVRDTKYESMRDEMPIELYRPYRQMEFVDGMNAYIRTDRDPEELFETMRRKVQGLDSNVPVVDMRTLEKQMELSLVTERLVASLSTAFALLATVLAGIGLYGVMAYTVARRTREIGIRMALGAFSGSVVWLVMREVLLLLAVGMGIGLPVAWGLSRFVQAQLYGMTPNDPITVLLAVGGIAGVAIMAGFFPARRATRIDPMRALRWE